MSFWSGISGTEKEAFNSDIQPLPHGTEVLAEIQSAELDDKYTAHYAFKWKILEGEYKGRLIFQKLYVFDEKETRAKKAKNMLMLMYGLFNIPLPPVQPATGDMYGFNGKLGRLIIGLYEIPKADGSIAKGNYVMEVHRVGNPTQSAPVSSKALDEDVPF